MIVAYLTAHLFQTFLPVPGALGREEAREKRRLTLAENVSALLGRSNTLLLLAAQHIPSVVRASWPGD